MAAMRVWGLPVTRRCSGWLFHGGKRRMSSEDNTPETSIELLRTPPVPMPGTPESFKEAPSLGRDEITKRVVKVVQDFPKVQASDVGPDSHFEKDLRLDSLDSVELVFALEDEFGVSIPDTDADKIRTCDGAIDYLDKLKIRTLI